MPSRKPIIKTRPYRSTVPRTTQNKALTPKELRALAGRIGKVDPQLAKQARQKGKSRVPTFLARTFDVLDKPRQGVFYTLFGDEGPKTGREVLKQAGFDRDYPEDKIIRNVGGFAIDVLADPLTYVTGGAGGLGRAATRRGIAREVGKQAGFDIGGMSAKQVLAEPKLKLLHSLYEEGGASTVSQIWRNLPSDVYNKLPNIYKGGVQLRLGFGRKAPRIPLVSGKVTSKVTAPVSKVLKKKLGPALEAITFGQRAEKSLEGHLFIKGLREAHDYQSVLERDFTNALDDAEKYFPRNDPEAVRGLFEGLWTPNPAAIGRYAPEQQEAISRLRGVLEDTLLKAEEAGININRLGGYAPRELSKEGRIAKYGVDLGARSKASSIPGASKARQKRFREDFNLADRELAEWYGLEPGKGFFSREPYEILGLYFKKMSKDISEHNLSRQMTEAGITLSSINRTTTGVLEEDLKTAGFKTVREALESAEKEIHGIPDPRLKEVNARTLEPLRKDAAERIRLRGESLDKQTKLALKKRGKVQDELVRGITLGDRMYTRSARLSQLGDAKEAASSSAQTLARRSEDWLEQARAQQLTGPVRAFVKGHARTIGHQAKHTKRLERVSKQIENLTTLRGELKAAKATTVRAELKTVREQIKKIEQVFKKNSAEINSGRDPILDVNTSQAFQAKYNELLGQAETLGKQIKTAGEKAPKTQQSLKEIDFKIKELTKAKEASEKELAGLEKFATSQNPDDLADGTLKDSVKAAMAREAKRVEKDIAKTEKRIISDTAKGIREEGKLSRLSERIAREQESLAKDIAKDERLQLQMEKDYEGLSGLLNKIENLEAGKRPSGKDWPAPKFHRGAPPKGYAKVDGTMIGVMNGKWAPEPIAAELNQALRVQNQAVLWKYFDSFLRQFKFWVTIPFPSFHLRNLVGGVTNNFLGGVVVSDYRLAQDIIRGRLDDALALPQLGGRTVGEVREYLTNYRIFHPKLAAQLAELIDEAPTTMFGKAAGKAQQGVRKLYGDTATQHIEGFLRTGAFIGGLRQLDDPYAARKFVMFRQGDYSELTASERSIARLIPFYRWTRTNLPLQLQSIAERPGKFMAIERFQRGVVGDPEAQEEFEKEAFIPDFLAKRGAVMAGPLVPSFLRGTPKEPAYISLDLPTADINEYVTPSGAPNLQGVLAASNPLVKGFVEGVMKRRIFSGGNIRPMIPASGAILPLGRMLESNPLTKGLTARAKGGELLVSSNVELVLQSLPTSRFSATARDIWPAESSLDQATGPQRLAEFSGVRLTPMTKKGQEVQSRIREKDLEELIGELYRREYGEEFKESAPKKTGQKKRATRKVSFASAPRSRSR